LKNGRDTNMRRHVIFAAGAILLLSLSIAPAGSKTHKTSPFSAAGITSGSNIAYPVNTLASGAVSLLLSLDGSANIQNVQVLRDSPPLTSSVQDAVQLWTFTPASLQGVPVASEISVTAIFNIFNPAGGAAVQSLVLAPSQSVYPDALQFMPPQITSASFANYPANSVAQGTVVLDVTLGAAGQPKQIRVVYGAPPLTQQATNAIKTWQFNAATFKGQPVSAHIIIAFVFQRNMS
jgi:TonB family protein